MSERFTSNHKRNDPGYFFDRLKYSCTTIDDLSKQVDSIIEQDNLKIDHLWEVYYSILHCIGAIKYDTGKLRLWKMSRFHQDKLHDNKSYYSETIETGLSGITKLIESRHGDILRKRVEVYVSKITNSSCPHDLYKAKIWKNQIKNLDNIKNYRAV